MVFMNATGTLYTIFTSMSQTTGSMFLTLLMLVFIIVVVFLVLGLALEWTVLFILPLLLVLMANDATFYPAGGALLLYVGFLLAKNFFFNK